MQSYKSLVRKDCSWLLFPRGERSHVKATWFRPSVAEALLSSLATLQVSGSDHLYSVTAVTRDVCPDTRLEEVTRAHSQLRQSRVGVYGSGCQTWSLIEHAGDPSQCLSHFKYFVISSFSESLLLFNQTLLESKAGSCLSFSLGKSAVWATWPLFIHWNAILAYNTCQVFNRLTLHRTE